MKVVILAGGQGTRISEESQLRPKPMVEIGDMPILWHIMKIYSAFGFQDFVICLGYKGYQIKEFFAHYYLHSADITFDLRNDNEQVIHHHLTEPWRVTLVNTGLETMTGGRIKRIQRYVGNETFMLTYGDGVGNVNIKNLLELHRGHGKLATITATRPSGRFGSIEFGEDAQISGFKEKPESSWISAGFFVFEPEVFSYIDGDSTTLEREPFENLARDGQAVAYKHSGFWHPMDTMRDKNYLDNLWKSGEAPWKLW